MKRTGSAARLATLLLCGLTLLTPLDAKTRHRAKRGDAAFDYYLLTLSWSPEYCHGNPGSPQCAPGKHFGFVVHGLWPEYKDGGGPENCSTQPGPSNPSSYLDIMPDSGLISHEWKTHGTCSGLDADAYFGKIREAFQSVRIPADLRAVSATRTVSPSALKQDFQRANPSLDPSDIRISCSGYYLKAVEICVSKDLKPITCSGVSDCTAQSIKVPPGTLTRPSSLYRWQAKDAKFLLSWNFYRDSPACISHTDFLA
jgi:ribonuclease T2